MNLQMQMDEQTNGLIQPLLGERKLEISHPYARSFLELYGSTSDVVSLLQHPFIIWLNTHECWSVAYQYMFDSGLITKRDRDTALFLVLELVCASSINYFIGCKLFHGHNMEYFKSVVVPSKKEVENVDKSIRELLCALNAHGGLYCKYETKQHLLQCLLKDIEKDQTDFKRNVYSAGTAKETYLRELMTKKFIHDLYLHFKDKKPKPRLIAHIALNISAIFFCPMDISDATELTRAIMENLDVDLKFMQQSIQSYLQNSLQ